MDSRRKDYIDHEHKSIWRKFKELFVKDDFFKRGLTVGTPLTPNSPQNKNQHPNHLETRQQNPEEIINHIDKTNFTFQERTLSFERKKNKLEYSTQAEIASAGKSKDSHVLNKPYALLKQLTSLNPNLSVVGAKESFVRTPHRRDEVFLPLTVNPSSDTDRFGLYLYAWQTSKALQDKVAKRPTADFKGFKVVVTAACLLGSTLQGVDEKKNKMTIIRHFIEFWAGQKIEKIDFNPRAKSPYEQMIFEEIEKLTELIDKISATEKDKKLVLHLPCYDYMLFGVDLFVRGRITFDALAEFFKAILEKRDFYITKISQYCHQRGVDLEIMSPFENLISPALEQIKDHVQFTMKFLESLNYSTEDKDEPLDNDVYDRIKIEDQFVKNCIKKLLDNQNNKFHQKVWKDFLTANISEIKNLEDLLKVANAVTIGIASFGKLDNEVCSYLPLSEKQIQIEFDLLTNIENLFKRLSNDLITHSSTLDELNKAIEKLPGTSPQFKEEAKLLEPWFAQRKIKTKLKSATQVEQWLNFFIEQETATISYLKNQQALLEQIKRDNILKNYPKIVNLTVLDNLLTYDAISKGSPFYVNQSEHNFCELIDDRKILREASRNISFFAYKTAYRNELIDHLNTILRALKPIQTDEVTHFRDAIIKAFERKDNMSETISTFLQNTVSLPSELYELIKLNNLEIAQLEKKIADIKAKRPNLENLLDSSQSRQRFAMSASRD